MISFLLIRHIGIQGDKTDQHYNRDSSQVIQGYQDIDQNGYETFSKSWITECSRVLRPGGSIYIVSGWSNLHHILNALHSTNLIEINHLIAQYTFGVYTKNKWVSSHYHILFWCKPGGKRTFNTNAIHLDKQQSYLDRQSVMNLPRDYQKGKVRNQNQLAVSFVSKFIAYSSNPSDMVMDPFCGSFSTRDAALSLNRSFIGFEINKTAFDYFAHAHILSMFDT